MPIEFFKGMGIGAGLIMAIGAQNAFVLSQGIRRHHVFMIPLVCSLCDMALIALGVAGAGSLIAMHPALTSAAAWGGAAFLFWYGLYAFKSACSKTQLSPAHDLPQTLFRTLATTLALTLLNPHVYLDTVVLLGSIASQFPDGRRTWFGTGAATASVIWFFSLSLGGRLLAPVFANPVSWKILDTVVGVTMWSIAGTLVFK
ncbi:MAG: LysE/ArgO family amino acid transporter [Pseudomonadota bacterium]